MPLIHGYSRAAISKNIRTEMHRGHSLKQSQAIAYSTARTAARKAHVPASKIGK